MVLGFICYSGAVAVLMVDVGQPLRAWFTFWHPNVHSMLTEVTFCLTCYLTVLLIEYVPVVLKNRKLRQIPRFLVFEFELHKVMPVLAGVGTFLSFFHQGSLGGLYGVLRGRPFAFRDGLGIWPSTFFLFVLSAAAAGPSFVLLTTWLVQKISRKRLVPPDVHGIPRQGLGDSPDRLRAPEGHRHACLDQPHLAVRGCPRLHVLYNRIRSGRGFCSPRSSCSVSCRRSCCSTRRLREKPGCWWARPSCVLRDHAEPVRHDHPDARPADAAVRRVPVLCAELAGEWRRFWPSSPMACSSIRFSFRYTSLFPQERELN